MKKIAAQILIGGVVLLSGIGSVSQAQTIKSEALSEKEKAIVPIAAFTASGDIGKLKPALNHGLDKGLSINEVKEILIHIYAYAGFPRSLNGINAFMSVVEERKVQGREDTIGREASPLPTDFEKNTYGNKVRNTLVGEDMSNRKSGYAAFAPAIDRFLVEHLFADIFARDVLSHQQRELVTISGLAALPGTEAQLQAHLKIAMNVGYNEAQLKNFIEILRDRVSGQAAERSTQVLGDLLGTPLSGVGSKAIQVTRKTAPQEAAPDHFTGKVSVESLFASQGSGSYSGGVVNFQAGARTAWHTHPAGQTLIIVSGLGLVQAEGEPAQAMQPGDVVWIPANVRHWHGASPNHAMSHVAIAEPENGSTVKWKEYVNDQQYGK
ncbi:MAG: carboxymuconolactone decarboxylase family protein [Desulfobulbus sp.]|nr:carboxymuconolactone decarboxylase family protein [Desulfobulbus sp.]